MTMEGDATAFFLKEIATSYSVLITRIAHGVPSGSELEYVNSTTILHAFEADKILNELLNDKEITG